jgi:hypothetical protein
VTSHAKTWLERKRTPYLPLSNVNRQHLKLPVYQKINLEFVMPHAHQTSFITSSRLRKQRVNTARLYMDRILQFLSSQSQHLYFCLQPHDLIFSICVGCFIMLFTIWRSSPFLARWGRQRRQIRICFSNSWRD